MNYALLAGMVAGLGLWIVWTGLRPVPEPLAAALARLDGGDGATRPRPAATDAEPDTDTRLGRLLLHRVPGLKRVIDQVGSDLRVVGRAPEEQAARVGVYTLAALVLGPWVGFVAWVVGMPLPVFVPPAVTVAGVAWGVLSPFVRLRREAADRRRAFAHALSAWCDVVVMSLAAGRGVDQAIETAAATGRAWAFAELRGALRAGYVRGETPWVALGRLGEELGVNDLSELANTVGMAGEEGAAVRATVAAKARTIRERITAEQEAEAAASTEKMGLPGVVLVLGFLLFLGYPTLSTMF